MTGGENEATKQPSWLKHLWERLWEGPNAGAGGQGAQQEVTQEESHEESSRWQLTRRQILLTSSGIAAVLIISVLVGYFFGITLWDWMKLLLVPAAIAAVGAWFTWQQQAHQNRITQDQSKTEHTLADNRATLDREIEEQRRQDEALQAYLEYMSQVLTERAPPFDEGVRATVRARTLALLGGARVFTDTTSKSSGKVSPQRGKSWRVGGLDPERKLVLVRFLYEADLIKEPSHVINLQGALLEEINLNAADLQNINLSGVDLSGADLSGADLTGTNLFEVNLSGAKGITKEQLDQAEPLQGTTMSDGQTLRGDEMPNGPTFEDWLKSKDRAEDE